MGWWVTKSGSTYTVVSSGPRPGAAGSFADGPYLTKALAEQAATQDAAILGGTVSGGSSTAATGDPWWVIKAFAAPGSTSNFVNSANPNNQPVPTYQVVQGATKPNPALIQTFAGTTPVVTGPFPTQAAAQATIPAGAAMGSGGGAGPGGSFGVPGVSPPNWLQGISDFFGALTSATTWLRVGEGVLGLILIAVGLAKLTHAVPIATRIAKTAGAVAL